MSSSDSPSDPRQTEPIYEPPDLERPASALPTEAELEEQTPVSIHLEKRDPYAALRIPDYLYYAIGSFIAAICGQMMDVAIGWEIAQRVGREHTSREAAMALGYVGLVLALPVIFFALPAGHIADRYDRRSISLISLAITSLGSFGLAAISYWQVPIVWVYVCLFLIGTANAFRGAALNALLPQLVPDELISNAITWNTSRWQIAATLGPAVGGFLIAATHSYVLVYILDAVGVLIFCVLLLPTRPRPMRKAEESPSWQSLIAGIQFVRSSKLILATITLDMFAVLWGGATMLLPLFARDILHVDAIGLGWLRAAPAIGAVFMGLALAHLPPMRRAGSALLWAVGGFGLATIGFGFSTNFYLSCAMLFLTGAFDSISVVVRHTLVQVLTPDHMRGRVSAVNSVFIGTSNEIGGFESGMVAAWVGPMRSVVLGGVGTILVVLGVAGIWPQVRALGRLDEASLETENVAVA
jgi:MFS family permease